MGPCVSIKTDLKFSRTRRSDAYWSLQRIFAGLMRSFHNSYIYRDFRSRESKQPLTWLRSQGLFGTWPVVRPYTLHERTRWRQPNLHPKSVGKPSGMLSTSPWTGNTGGCTSNASLYRASFGAFPGAAWKKLSMYDPSRSAPDSAGIAAEPAAAVA